MKIPVSKPNLCGNEKKYILDCIKTNWISYGKYVNKFEKEFTKYIGTKYASSCSSGTSALHLAMLALGIKGGDEVIIPALTFVSSMNSILYNNAIPVLIDSENDTWNMNVDQIEKKITKKTKAVMAVHLYGHPVDLDPVREICEKHGLFLIEDTAEAIGSRYKGKKVGSIGDVSIFSFYGNKTITTGEGGMVATNDVDIIDRIKILKDQGKSKQKRYWHEIIGYNYRMTNIQASIGLAQLENINKFIKRKREIAKYYHENLQIEGIRHPAEKKYAFNTYWLYSVILNDNLGIYRDELIMKLAKLGIETRPFFIPMNKLPIYRSYFKSNENYPVAENLSRNGINLPSSSKLKNEELEYICNSIKKKLGRRR